MLVCFVSFLPFYLQGCSRLLWKRSWFYTWLLCLASWPFCLGDWHLFSQMVGIFKMKAFYDMPLHLDKHIWLLYSHCICCCTLRASMNVELKSCFSHFLCFVYITYHLVGYNNYIICHLHAYSTKPDAYFPYYPNMNWTRN